jgi:hypothetical protein
MSTADPFVASVAERLANGVPPAAKGNVNHLSGPKAFPFVILCNANPQLAAAEGQLPLLGKMPRPVSAPSYWIGNKQRVDTNSAKRAGSPVRGNVVVLNAARAPTLECRSGKPFATTSQSVQKQRRRGQTPADSAESLREVPALFESCRKVSLLACHWHR